MKKILLIEDDKFLIRIYQKALEAKGYQIELLENGVRAVGLAKSFKPDLILLDLVMPVVDGFEALSKLRHDPETKDQPVFVITALETDEDIARIKTLGVERYFLKSSTDFNRVVEEISNYLQNK